MKAQEWLDRNYPKEQRSKIKKLKYQSLTNNLEGYLDLSDFPNLEKLEITDQTLTLIGVNLTKNKKLKKIKLFSNGIYQDLSTFSHLTQLEVLDIGETGYKWNNFYGSLESLKNCKELRYVFIGRQNKITGGLEHLPSENLYWFGCRDTFFQDILLPYSYNVKYWQFAHKNNITELPSEELKRDLKRELELKSIIFHNHSTKAEAEQELIQLQEKLYGGEREEVSSEYSALSEIAPSDEERTSSFPVFKYLGVFGLVGLLIFLCWWLWKKWNISWNDRDN